MEKSQMGLNVTLIMVMSVNGIVAQEEVQNSFEWNSSEDREQFLQRIHQIGSVIMGSNTYRSIGSKPYPGIEFFVLTSHPERFAAREKVTFVQGDVREICSQIHSRGINQIALLGGSKTNTQFFNHHLINEIVLTIEPLIMQTGMQIIDQPLQNIPLLLQDVEQLNSNGTLLLHFLVNNRSTRD